MSAPQFSANTDNGSAGSGSTRTALRLSAIGLFGLCGAGLALSFYTAFHGMQDSYWSARFAFTVTLSAFAVIVVAIELHRIVRKLAQLHSADPSSTLRFMQPHARNILIVLGVAGVLRVIANDPLALIPGFAPEIMAASSSHAWAMVIALLTQIMMPILPTLAAASVYLLLRCRTQGRAVDLVPRVLMAIPVVITLILLGNHLYRVVAESTDSYSVTLILTAYLQPLGFSAIRCAIFAAGYWAIRRASISLAEGETLINLHAVTRPLIYIGAGFIAHSVVYVIAVTAAAIGYGYPAGILTVFGILASLDLALAGIGLLFLALALVLRSWPEPIGATAPWQEQPQ